MNLGTWEIDDLMTFSVNTHTPSTGAETDADAEPEYRVYENETSTPILTGTMSLLDDANTVGQYSEQVTLSAANGFEVGKSYSIRIRAVVGGVAGSTVRQFQVELAPATAAGVSAVEADTQDIQGRLPAGLVSGRIDSSVGAMDTGVITNTTIASNAISSDELATSAVNEIRDAVWANSSRELTSGTNIVLAKGTGVTGFNDLSAAEVNAEVDTGLTDYDAPTNAEMVARTLPTASYALQASVDTLETTVAAIDSKTANLPSDPADQSLIIAATNQILTDIGDVPTNAELATALGTADDALLVQVALVKARTDLIPASPAAVGSAMALTSGERDSIAAALLDLAAGVETSLTLRQALRLLVAAEAGKLSGAATTTITIRNVGDSKNRITATVDADGNRSAVVYDLT